VRLILLAALFRLTFSLEIYCKPVAGNQFVLVSAKAVEAGQKTTWQFALVNKDEHMFDILFTSEEHLISSIFKAKEIWYRSEIYPEIYPNEMFGKRDEMKVLYDLSDKS